MCILTMNNELQGIELKFDGKPESKILSALKENGFRWHNVKKIWYAKQSEKTLALGKQLADQSESETITETKTEVIKNNTLSFWDRCQFVASEVNQKQGTKEITKEARQHIKARFPEVKFSITNNHRSIYCEIVSSPYEKESEYLKAIQGYCTNYIQQYNYCTCYDPYGDYGSSYNFFGGNCSIDYSYNQTEGSEAINNDLKDFDIKKAAFEVAEEERKELEYQAYKKQQEADHLAYQEAEKQRESDYKNIIENVTVKDIEENNQYMIYNCKFANLNKNNTMTEYQEEVAKDDYTLEDIKITKELHFTNSDLLDKFSNMFLFDFDFIKGSGGNYTNDLRVKDMIDYQNMEEEEKQSVKWYLEGIAIYLNNELQFVSDPQGFGYCRYIGLTDEARPGTLPEEPTKTSEILALEAIAEEIKSISTSVIINNNLLDSWQGNKEYYKLMNQVLKANKIQLEKNIIQQVDILELKYQLYTLLTWSEELPDQFAEANISEGEKLTIFYMGGMGGILSSKITFNKFEPCQYAQYDKAVKLIFKQERKRGLYSSTFYRGKGLIVFKGWHDLPKNILYNIKEERGFIITEGKFSSCDKRQFKAITDYFYNLDIEPIIQDKQC